MSAAGCGTGCAAGLRVDLEDASASIADAAYALAINVSLDAAIDYLTYSVCCVEELLARESDLVTTSDEVSLAMAKGLGELVEFAEVLSFIYSRNFSDAAGATDAVSLTPGKRFLETIGLLDAAAFTPGKAVAESLAATDAAELNPIKNLNEIVDPVCLVALNLQDYAHDWVDGSYTGLLVLSD